MKIPRLSKSFGHPHAYEWHDGHTDHHRAIAKADEKIINEQAAPVGVKTYGQFAQHYGTINPGKQTNLKFYNLDGKNKEITDQVGQHGFQVYYAGGKYGKPDLANKNYNTKHLMVYDPSPELGASFEDEKYTDSWRKVHELAHALTYPTLNEEYGEGRRLGKLGVRSPREAERAVKWEWLAAHKQRDLLGQLGVHLSDEDFHRELNTVMHDAIHRAVTGQFTEPSHEGFEPHSYKVPLETALNMVREHATKMGLNHPEATLRSIKKSEDEKMKIPKVKYNIEKACWEGYEMVGMKTKDGREVPNCVPKKKKKSEPNIGDMMAKTEELLAQVRLMKEESSEYAGHMVKSNLYKIAKSAQELYEMFDDTENVEPWVEEKIAICANNIDTVADYMEYQRVRQGRMEDEVNVGEDDQGVDEYPQPEEEVVSKTEKKYSKKVKNPKTGREKTVRYGAKGYTIAPGTSRGDSYCARSYGQMKDHPGAANDPNSPLRLSRKKWKCSGKTSRKSEPDMGEMMAKAEELLAQFKKLKGE